jgi:hypothetical protein
MAVTDDPVAASELENVIAVFGGVVDRAVQDDAAGATRARALVVDPSDGPRHRRLRRRVLN